MNSVNKIRLRSQSTYFTAGGSGDDSVHVSSVITSTLRCEHTWVQTFSDNKLYLLLLSARFGAMTTRSFLPTNRRLNLELLTYYYYYLYCWYTLLNSVQQCTQYEGITLARLVRISVRDRTLSVTELCTRSRHPSLSRAGLIETKPCKIPSLRSIVLS